MNKENKEQTKVEGINLKQIELPKTDYKQFVGKTALIQKVETHKGNYGYFLKIITENLNTKDNPVYAIKIFGLQQDQEGNIGWGKDTKLGKFLKNVGVENIEELVGIKVMIQLQPNTEKDYLTFV